MSVSTNLKAIEEIKGEILSEVARLYKALADYDEAEEFESVSDKIATIIAMDYILAKRLGIDYSDIDKKIIELLTIGEESGHELELEFADMSGLKKFIKSR